jgi:hypothetical protein
MLGTFYNTKNNLGLGNKKRNSPIKGTNFGAKDLN